MYVDRTKKEKKKKRSNISGSIHRVAAPKYRIKTIALAARGSDPFCKVEYPPEHKHSTVAQFIP